ncbi:MAG: hypothetical protein ACK5Y2_09920 [Bdellovibrionales bacterium]
MSDQDLLKKFNSGEFKTPAYIYDLKRLQSQYTALAGALGSRFEIFYSMKANPHPTILSGLQALGSSVDVSSAAELESALKAKFRPQQVSFVGPGKTEDEIRGSIQHQIGFFVVESAQELENLIRILKEENQGLDYLIRVNPNGKRDLPSQFGIDEDQIADLRPLVRSSKLARFKGFHFYNQNQILDPALIGDRFHRCLQSARALEDSLGARCEVINLGGGFGIPYFEGQFELSLPFLKSLVSDLLSTAGMQEFRNVRLLVESGRFLVGPSGFFATRVLYKKASRGKTVLVCDGGLTQNQAAVGVGQIIRRNFSIHVLQSRPNTGPREKVLLAGPSCYSLDVLGSDVEVPISEPGDVILVQNCGAYGPTFSPQNFISRPEAYEYFL